MSSETVLIVEDDVRLGALLQEYLISQGFVVDLETHGDAATTRILSDQPELVILDWKYIGHCGISKGNIKAQKVLVSHCFQFNRCPVEHKIQEFSIYLAAIIEDCIVMFQLVAHWCSL